ncbi:DUF2163 domain-containing protein [Xanthomonas oryzae]|uniref:DUF2163 domain-containing protein n=1 Tax=Xanthomonas oryzae TaxID=347 RepID=UPI00041E9F6E|nr:DUF2163 domain-containing protein [Xanthomonas oryzae]AVU00517.1 DUF2163 domain-containing protein [Xanthomonas oryzae pv. oryzae]QBN29799.1 DUF2163 domain-containing protein [Xanthomonas oryzae pv. oryzae]QBN62544.1 DUF2163 domain-containing protein [Xanthomonas oryzae pv. oryzae]QBN66189.1 DUF2163 domain-containing protein [Xanthomonas oryzae pv. oryzae]
MKDIPLLLREHLAQDTTTTCILLKVVCAGTFAGRVLGFTSLDETVVYHDGLHTVAYTRDNGFYPAAYEASSELSADNTDVTGYASDSGITIADVQAGVLDNAQVTIYRVNYMDLGMGHEIVGYGKTGRAAVTGQRWKVAFKSLIRLLEQTINPVWSLTCRAQYGDGRCGLPFEWFAGSVAQPGSDPLRLFVPSGLSQVAGDFAPGVLEWQSGDNAGAQMEVESYAPSSLQLSLTMPFPINAGDRFRIRRDCDKTHLTCKARGNLLRFRGEHLTPVAQAALMVPGAYVKTKT